jgi:excisionase family DNA binding protein
MEKNFWNTYELAEYLRISYDTANRMLRTGKIEAYKVGGDWRIRPEVVEKYLEQNKNTAQA